MDKIEGLSEREDQNGPLASQAEESHWVLEMGFLLSLTLSGNVLPQDRQLHPLLPRFPYLLSSGLLVGMQKAALALKTLKNPFPRASLSQAQMVLSGLLQVGHTVETL